MLGHIVDKVKATAAGKDGRGKKVMGTVVLMKKNVLDFNDFNASIIDRLDELIGRKVSLQLISAENGDPGEFSTCLIFCLNQKFIFTGKKDQKHGSSVCVLRSSAKLTSCLIY
ncbi:hypothetical protein SLEP1_g30780 [Rubroshorea leprosula]|uniref:Uncharacterized protein n=1 Tax=Rubroshorea leprosula TaxID=152421 RepID=A0AAV5K1A5_9ROSI|nr:hypothetical protein SLEP1_g30780 [Rubroshorea leprosula]